MAVSALAGCQNKTANGSSSGSDSSSSGPVPITISSWPKSTDSNYSTYQQQLTDFKAKYPNIQVTTDEWAYDVNSFLPKAASGQLPTVYYTWFTEANKIMDAGYAKDVTAIAKQEGYTTTLNPALLKVMTRSSKIYGLPVNGYSMGLICNVNLFKQAGLVDANGVPKFPKTWDEVAADAQTIKAKTGKAGFAIPTESNNGGWMFMNIAWSYGTVFETKTNGKWKATFNSSEGVAALQYLKDLKFKYNVLPDSNLLQLQDVYNLIGTDQLAMTIAGGTAYNSIISTTKISKDAMAATKMPAGPKGTTALMGGNLVCFAPNATTAQVEAGLKWQQFTGYTTTMSDATKTTLEQTAQTNAGKGLVVGPSTFPIWVDSSYTKAIDEINTKYANVNLAMFSSYSDHSSEDVKVEEPFNTQELYKAFDSIIQNVYTNKDLDLAKTLDTAAANFQSDYLNNVQS